MEELTREKIINWTNKEVRSYVEAFLISCGLYDLFSYLDKTDYFEAPASTHFHESFETGLVRHSLSVGLVCWKLASGLDLRCDLPARLSLQETCILLGLIHDLCKINMYTVSYKNVKNSDGNWVKESYYSVVPNYDGVGHGVESWFRFAPYLKDPSWEKMKAPVIFHMGSFDITDMTKYCYGFHCKENPFVNLLSSADKIAADWMPSQKFGWGAV